MSFDQVSKEALKLSYRDKLRLAQLMIQLARKEEEEQNPEKRVQAASNHSMDPELLEYVHARLVKLRPSRKATLLNSIDAMFQFQGGISEADKAKLLAGLVKKGLVTVTENDRIKYREAS